MNLHLIRFNVKKKFMLRLAECEMAKICVSQEYHYGCRVGKLFHIEFPAGFFSLVARIFSCSQLLVVSFLLLKCSGVVP